MLAHDTGKKKEKKFFFPTVGTEKHNYILNAWGG